MERCTVPQLQTLTAFMTQPAAPFTLPVLHLCLQKRSSTQMKGPMELKKQTKQETSNLLGCSD